MVVDVCTYNNERDIWDIHYNVLKDHVDQFIVVEFDTTFSGKLKGPTFPVEQYPDVKYVFSQEKDYEKYRALAESSPNTKGAAHWVREFMQKESIKDALIHLKDDDTVFIGDVDEIWHPAMRILFGTFRVHLRVYTYYLNLRSNEEFCGTLKTSYKNIRDKCLNHLRTSTKCTHHQYGWHFTSMGGPVSLAKKLTDSYTEESYATPVVLGNLDQNYGTKDFLGRDFTYEIDTSEWPHYLKENVDKYEHLLKPV